jgi:hypothetical protein
MSETTGAIETVDFVTVVYERDILSLKLQAMSIARNFRADDIGRIFIVVNELAPEHCYSLLQTHVLPEYGKLISKVEIMPMTRMMRPHVRIPGQKSQQALKLLASRLVGSQFYLALDPKNHFIQKSALENVVDLRIKKARTYKSRRNRAPDKAVLEALDYFQVEATDFELTSVAPFPFHTATVREMIDKIETREGAHFDDFMLDRGYGFTEYSLYFAFLLTKDGGPGEHYRFGSRNSALISRRAPAEGEAFKEFITSLEGGPVMTFGIHRSRVVSLSEAEWEMIIPLWLKANLFDDAGDAKRYIADLTNEAKSGSG